jgi:hypothetical protein
MFKCITVADFELVPLHLTFPNLFDCGHGLKEADLKRFYGSNINPLRYVCKTLMIVISGDHREGLQNISFLYSSLRDSTRKVA